MTTTNARAEQIAAFYARHADRLRRVVAVNVHAPEQTIEDACQNAWAILLRHPEVTLEHGGFAWLATVAIREAWRLASRARELPVARLPARRPRARHRARAARRHHRPGRPGQARASSTPSA